MLKAGTLANLKCFGAGAVNQDGSPVRHTRKKRYQIMVRIANTTLTEQIHFRWCCIAPSNPPSPRGASGPLIYVAYATPICCNSNMHATNTTPDPILSAIFQRRAIRHFQPVDIAASTRDLLFRCARQAPSSFNMQPYRLYWIESPERVKAVAELCVGQKAAKTASALVVAVGGIGFLGAPRG